MASSDLVVPQRWQVEHLAWADPHLDGPGARGLGEAPEVGARDVHLGAFNSFSEKVSKPQIQTSIGERARENIKTNTAPCHCFRIASHERLPDRGFAG